MEKNRKLLDYQTMQFREKADYLWHHGIFLSGRKTSNFLVELYALDNFFVELFMSHSNWNIKDQVIICIKCFQNTDLLQPYLE
ncbi:MAG: hypothetical protein ACNS62_14775 [Candidatus Cyclobacteriaceae bacterium M3_2C_046]